MLKESDQLSKPIQAGYLLHQLNSLERLPAYLLHLDIPDEMR